jgi:transketolase
MLETPITKLRRRIIEVAYRDGMGHIPSALSILDIVWCLYDRVMTKDDQFILSKGHGVMALYAVLEEKGLMTWNSRLMGHPKRGGAILASTGSLGHGLPMAVGLAIAKKIKGESGRVFCLVGDGECNEGATWESAMVAAHHKLDNLVVMVDWNGSSERALSVGNLDVKFRAFDWISAPMDGHHLQRIEAILKSSLSIFGKPFAVVFDTIKGNGVPFMQSPEWHNKKLSEQDYKNALYLS